MDFIDLVAWVLLILDVVNGSISALEKIYHTNDEYDIYQYDTVSLRETYEEVMTNYPSYYFGGLTRITPKEVGEVRVMTIEDRHLTITTLAFDPPIYEITNYLSEEECELIKDAALDEGLFKSTTLDNKDNEFSPQTSADNKEKVRISEQAWLFVNEAKDKYFDTLYDIRERLIQVTGLPRRIIEDSEAMQVARYGPGGHYHAHLDSTEYNTDEHASWEDYNRMPCCHLVYESECSPSDKCCKLCRYMTVMYYLSDVEEGGETAFINAKLHPRQKDKIELEYNLSYNCSDANLRIKPKKGSAILWYNHRIDPNTGWLGEAELNSLHGGCDVTKGTKWIGNNWINVPPYEWRYEFSVYNSDYAIEA